MNEFILKIFDEFHKQKISYCHFKSNNKLVDALSGVDDLDLLVSQADRDKFLQVLVTNGFRIASDRGNAPTPYVSHFYGVDDKTGLIVHLHVYFKIITGGSILKNHWISVEKMFLDSAEPLGPNGVYIPSAEADLILFVIRKFIEQPSLIEHYLFIKDFDNIMKELEWLNDRISITELHKLLENWLPSFSTLLFDKCLNALLNPSSTLHRIYLGIRVRRIFDKTVYSSFEASIRRSILFFGAHARGRLGFLRNNRILYPGGLLISFVGSEASGKSTSAKEAFEWLSQRFDVTYIHLGKPEKNWRTKPFWVVIKIYSKIKLLLIKFKKSSSYKIAPSSSLQLNLPNPIVCVLDSMDRKYWLNKNYSSVLKGGILITDRYPNMVGNGLDSSRITPISRFSSVLSKIEKSNYSSFPYPDLVFKMMAPLETTLERNSQRPVPEPELFVRDRYELAKNIKFPLANIIEIDTSDKIEITSLQIKNSIWSVQDHNKT